MSRVFRFGSFSEIDAGLRHVSSSSKSEVENRELDL
jgi:hypothetical protein